MQKYLLPFMLLYTACQSQSQSAMKSIEGLYEVNKMVMNNDEIPLDDNLLCVMLAMETESQGYLTYTKKRMVLAKDTKTTPVHIVKNGMAITIIDINKKVKLGSITGDKLILFVKKGKYTSSLSATKTTNNL